MKDTCIHLSDEMPFSFAAIFKKMTFSDFSKLHSLYMMCLTYIGNLLNNELNVI